MAPPLAQARVRLDREEAVDVRAVADHEHVVGRDPALHGDPAIGLVGRDHDVGPVQGPALDPAEHSVAEPRAAEARTEQLGHQVVLVEDHQRAGRAWATRREIHEVRRVGEVDDVERALALQSVDQPPRPPERLPVLAEVAERRLRRPERIAVNLDPVDRLVRRLVGVPGLRADHGHVPAGGRQRPALVPDPAVLGRPVILDHHQDTAAAALVDGVAGGGSVVGAGFRRPGAERDRGSDQQQSTLLHAFSAEPTIGATRPSRPGGRRWTAPGWSIRRRSSRRMNSRNSRSSTRGTRFMAARK